MFREIKHVIAFQFSVTPLHLRQQDLLGELCELPLIGFAFNRLFVNNSFF